MPHLARSAWIRLLAIALPLLASLMAAGTAGAAADSLLGDLGRRLGLTEGSNEPLRPEQAFIFSAQSRDTATVVARWDIADGYYLYRQRFKFSLKDSPGLSLGAPVFPTGKMKDDPAFGRMEVYLHQVAIALPITRNTTAEQPLTLVAEYQGCAEFGFCYPPIKQEIRLTLPAGPASATPSPGPIAAVGPAEAVIGPITDQDRYAASLASKTIWINMALFFGLGLLLCFTPCVLPMIPILSSIIVGQGSALTTRRAFLLSLTYVLAMALTYTVAGVLAGLFGANLQSWFQNPWILGGFAAVFVLLALAMFGLYDLQMPNAIQSRLSELANRQRGGSIVGVAVMGFLSALIVGPCVAAPLAGALIYIGQSGDAVLGGAALFALSLGMGAPLLLIGTSAGKWLPKAGDWMNTIKAVFGVMLLAVAIVLLERIVPAAVALLLWAALLVVSAVYMGALERLQPEANGWRKLWKGVGLLLLIYGGILIVGAASGGRDLFRPLQNLAVAGGNPAAATSRLEFQRIKGLTGLQQALAASQGRPVMLDFYADWCISCKELEQQTFADPRVKATLAGVTLLQADVTANDTDDQALLKAYNLIGPPSILFFGPDGQERRPYRVVGFLNAEKFAAHAKAALN